MTVYKEANAVYDNNVSEIDIIICGVCRAERQDAREGNRN